jgi:hypothetical protein
MPLFGDGLKIVPFPEVSLLELNTTSSVKYALYLYRILYKKALPQCADLLILKFASVGDDFLGTDVPSVNSDIDASNCENALKGTLVRIGSNLARWYV